MKKGYGGGMGMPGNMQNLMKQAQRMQRQMEEKQKEMAEMEFSGTAGGGAVQITVNGKKTVTKVAIDPEVLDPEDVETLEQLVLLAVNDAFSKVDAANESAYSAMAGGIGMPGLGGLGL